MEVPLCFSFAIWMVSEHHHFHFHAGAGVSMPWGRSLQASVCPSLYMSIGSNRHRSSPSLPWDWGMLKYCREKLRECLRICVLFVSRVRRREGQRRKLELNLNQWQVEIRAVAQLTAASQGEAGEGLQLSKLGLLIGPQFCSMEM